ncbi:hypothetical protein E2C01_068156 [Portunus trituberculatus]|uniref:Uncharacterized protein n=1 Tax=Portunus trituberculatus TaxID=210409 RepID=A0A5B7HX54_PORTR|nr:hypothetical protein [Portunus trituberculatus]
MNFLGIRTLRLVRSLGECCHESVIKEDRSFKLPRYAVNQFRDARPTVWAACVCCVAPAVAGEPHCTPGSFTPRSPHGRVPKAITHNREAKATRAGQPQLIFRRLE